MAWTAPRTWTDGELVTAAIMNPHIRDNLRVVPHTIPKTADQSVTSSTTLVDDTHLQFAIGSSEAWEFEMILAVNAMPGFFKMALTAPSGATGWWALKSTDNATATVELDEQVTATFVDGETASSAGSAADVMRVEGFVLNSSTGGTFKLRWAQLSSNGTATTIKRGSRLIRRLVT